MDKLKLVEEAFLALNNAYAEYSQFKVGAALILKNGTVIHGANIENASYGLTICAERSALVAAYSQGYRAQDILGLAVVSECNPPASPCGACRQVIHELLESNTPIYIANSKGIAYETTPEKLLPLAFKKDQLK